MLVLECLVVAPLRRLELLTLGIRFFVDYSRWYINGVYYFNCDTLGGLLLLHLLGCLLLEVLLSLWCQGATSSTLLMMELIVRGCSSKVHRLLLLL